LDDEPTLKITISPEPTVDERDAVVAALAVLLLADEPAPEVQTAPMSRWARAGRVEAMGSIERRPDRGWGRTTRT
jgi:hypothetical protein